MNWWMLMATTYLTYCQWIQPYTGQIHPEVKEAVIHVRPSRAHPVHTPAPSQLSRMCMVRLVSAMKAMGTRRHGICQKQRTYLQPMLKEALGMTTSGVKPPRGTELNGGQDLPLSSILTITELRRFGITTTR